MKTLSDLKRDLTIGTAIEMTFNEYAPSSERVKTLVGVKRYVVKKSTTGVQLSPDKNAVKGSQLDYPAKATLCEYDGETLNIYNAGLRELTDNERSILENKPSVRLENREAVRDELMTDGSSFYWKDKAYLKEHDAEYLAGHETIRGMRYDFNTKMIIDEKIKGNLSLAYKIIKE